MADGSDELSRVDLCDLDRFASGFPHETFRLLRRVAPVWFHPPTDSTPDGEGFWVLSGHAEVTRAAADAGTYSSEGGGGRSGGGTLIEDLPAGFAAGVLLNMTDDPLHQSLRKLALPAVSPRALAGLEDDLRARAARIVEEALERGEVDFLVDVAAELPLQAVAQLLGVPQEDRHLLFGWANATLDYEDRELGQASAASAGAAAEMAAYGTELIEAKRRSPGEDLLSVYVHAEIPDGEGGHRPLGELELVMFFNLLIAAGSETTRNAIAGGLLALLDHRGQWRDLSDEPSVGVTACEEILRWTSPTTYNRRTATRDTVIGGVEVAAGEKVTLWWGSANFDEEVFEDPYRFDIRRDPNRHVAFGHGPHFCLGANLARLEIRLLFEELCSRVGEVERSGAVEWVRSNKHTGIRRMPVRLLPA